VQRDERAPIGPGWLKLGPRGDAPRVHVVADCYAHAATVEMLRNALTVWPGSSGASTGPAAAGDNPPCVHPSHLLVLLRGDPAVIKRLGVHQARSRR
jgi:hypothetical protein